MSLLPKLPYKWRIYWHGLFAAIYNSLGSSSVVAIVDPDDFNPFSRGSWSKLGAVVVVTMVMAFVTYIQSHPLPDPDKDTDATAVMNKKIDLLEAAGTAEGDSDL